MAALTLYSIKEIEALIKEKCNCIFAQRLCIERQKDTMTLQNNDGLLDDVGWQIIEILQEDARISFRDLGRRIGLSAPASAERVRKMEEAGIIRGYRAEIDHAKVGLPVTAFIRFVVPKDKREYIQRQLDKLPEVLECYRLAGIDSFIMKVSTPSIAHLEGLLDRLGQYGQSTTSIVLSAMMTRRSVEKIDDNAI
jgi:Lrp/AsnC family leucine-responsive transcriptional regulator